MNSPFEALYIHVPFCAQRCDYCDFITTAIDGNNKRVDKYTEGLISNIRRASKAELLGDIKTIYIGGGTPTHLGHKRLISLIYALTTSINIPTDAEFTVEANPESLTHEMVKDMYALGVGRISLGVQSFIDDELSMLGRIHNAQRAQEAIAWALDRMDSVSIDLMCGLPGQTMENWEYNLQMAVDSGVQHVSIYPLTLENNTVLDKKVRRRKLPAIDNDLQADMMEKAQEYLNKAGMERYEVASYALKGHQSRHNIAYWTGVPYLGLGRGAASMFKVADGQQVCDADVIPGFTQEYLDTALDLERIRTTVGDDALFFESLSSYEVVAEDGMLAMRMSEGIGPEQMAEYDRLVPGFSEQLVETLEECIGLDLVDLRADGRYVPNQRGWLLGNEIYERIWDLAESLYKQREEIPLEY